VTGFEVVLGRLTDGAPGNRKVEATVYLAEVELLSIEVPLSSGPGADREAEAQAMSCLALKLKRVLEAS